MFCDFSFVEASCAWQVLFEWLGICLFGCFWVCFSSLFDLFRWPRIVFVLVLCFAHLWASRYVFRNAAAMQAPLKVWLNDNSPWFHFLNSFSHKRPDAFPCSYFALGFRCSLSWSGSSVYAVNGMFYSRFAWLAFPCFAKVFDWETKTMRVRISQRTHVVLLAQLSIFSHFLFCGWLLFVCVCGAS